MNRALTLSHCTLVLLISTACLAQGRVVPAGFLHTARTDHTATRLRDGRVLIVGGRGLDALRTLATAEVFDPKTKKWSAAARLSHGRAQHTATLLGDGRVFVTGGTTHESTEGGLSRFVAVASAEMYEPQKNVWLTVEAMHEPRNGHSATLLADGRVLVVGGAKSQRSHLASVELFDPATSSWVVGASLQVARWQHQAVRLADGTVAVIGGRSNHGRADEGSGRAVTQVERYVNGEWQTVAPLSEPRQRTAAVLRGNEVMVIAGIGTTTATNDVETWSPGAPSWAHLDSHLAMALSAHTASVIDADDVVVIGGEPPDAVDTAQVQRWSSTQLKWCAAGRLSTARKHHTATTLTDGTIFVVGGLSAGVPEASAEWWQPSRGACVELAP